RFCSLSIFLFCTYFFRGPPTQPTLFPYTTLFRSRRRGQVAARQRARAAVAARLRGPGPGALLGPARALPAAVRQRQHPGVQHHRSEEHTSELQSRENLVCRLLLEKKNQTNKK